VIIELIGLRKKLSFTREVEVIASTLQPASTIHTFTFNLPAPSTPLAPTPSGDLLRASVLSNPDNRASAATFAYPYSDDPFARPSSAYLGPPTLLGHGSHSNPAGVAGNSTTDLNSPLSNTVTYYGVCLTVWSHADAERSSAIRRTLEAGRSRKESAQSAVTSRLKHLRSDLSGSASDSQDPTSQARRSTRRSSRGPWADAETDGETEGDGAVSESDFEVASTIGHGPGESTLFLPGDTVFWLPYALSMISFSPSLVQVLTTLLQHSFLATLSMTSCGTISPFPGRAFLKTSNHILCKSPKFLHIQLLVLVTLSN